MGKGAKIALGSGIAAVLVLLAVLAGLLVGLAQLALAPDVGEDAPAVGASLATGTPWSPRRRLVRSLSPAISTSRWAVVEAIVAWIFRWFTP